MAPENGRWNSGVTCELFVDRLLVRVTQKFNVKTAHVTTTALNLYIFQLAGCLPVTLG